MNLACYVRAQRLQVAAIMLFALFSALVAVALFVGTLTLTPPPKSRLTVLPPRPAVPKLNS